MDSSQPGKTSKQYSLKWDEGPEESQSVLNSPEEQKKIHLAVRRRGFSEDVAAASMHMTVARLLRAIGAGKGSPVCRRDSLVAYAVVTAQRDAVRIARPEQRQHDLVRALHETMPGERASEADPLSSAIQNEVTSATLDALLSLP